MTRRIVLEIVLIIVLTVLLAWLMIGVTTAIASGGDPFIVFVDQAPRALLGFLGPALALWALLVIIVSITLRTRAPRSRIGAHLVALIAALALDLGLLALVAGAAGGAAGDAWGLLVLAGAAAVGAQLLVAGVVVVLSVELLILPPSAPAELDSAPLSPPE